MPTTKVQDERPLPIQVEHESRNRTGTEPDQTRIEELLHQGLRPKDARRIERLERELDLPEEQCELDRVRAAAVLRSDLDTRKKVLGELAYRVHQGRMTAYEGLCRLQDLEVVGEECTFLRTFGISATRKVNLICYVDTEPQAAFKFMPSYSEKDTYNLYKQIEDLSDFDSLPD
jgi:hypothetical protein